MDLNGIISNQNGDEHLGAKDVTIKKKYFIWVGIPCNQYIKPINYKGYYWLGVWVSHKIITSLL